MQTLARALLLILIAVATFACQRSAPLFTPAPIGANADVETTRSAIHQALSQTEWALEKEVAGEILAKLEVRTHVARVRITYDSTRVDIIYVASDNLMYEEGVGGAVIHKQYNVWVDGLAKAIQAALQTGQRYPVAPLSGAPPPASTPSAPPAPPPPIASTPAPIATTPAPAADPSASAPPAPAPPPPPSDGPRSVVPVP
jgi:hypothetical protein